MIVRGLDATNFRNIKRASLTFSETFNLITGLNAQGKTNLIEAIHFFSLGRSFRTRRADDAIMFGEEYSFLRLHGRSDLGVEFRIEVGMDRGGRVKASVDGKRLGGLSEIIGIVPTVIFTPDDVSLASGPPRRRRLYLDYTTAQISPAFLGDIKEYRKILKQRNSLLRDSAELGIENDEIDSWNDMLARRGASIVRGREKTLSEIAKRAGALYREILPGGDELKISYVCSFNPEGKDPEEALREALVKVKESEKRRGYTLAGPHYDDISVFLGSSGLRRYGSQGRKRLTAIVLKLTQAAIIMKRRRERPVVLLDDIFSELDNETAARVRELLSDTYQSFITSPRPEDFRLGAEGAAYFRVEKGQFTVIEDPMSGHQ
ncbi:MAG: DNA replication/repair protein RecF [Candidatus Krumholzibacteria bacterium]|nr:DNA replication/repair protein RecF [Candidatus Krumholzibacteria bacterium]